MAAAVASTSATAAGYDVPMDENANGYMWGMISPQELSTILSNPCEKVSMHVDTKGTFIVLII